MSAPTGLSPRRLRGIRRFAPVAALGLVAVLAALSIATGMYVARIFRDQAVTASRLYAAVYGGLNDPGPDAAMATLFELGEGIRELGIPLVVTDNDGRVAWQANLPFVAHDTSRRVREYIAELDRVNLPIPSSAGTIHFGPVPAAGILRTLAALQLLTLLVMVGVGWVAYRNALHARRDRLWFSMAREAAHQMGTPLTSLQGWIEQLRGDTMSPARVAQHLDADAERLERVAQRFERIGNPARRNPVPLSAVAERVVTYFRARLPRHANPITLELDSPGTGPVVAGDPVLLEWAFETLVKNAIDALQGRGGRIVVAIEEEPAGVVATVSDNGPGIPREIRRTLFEPGVTTKRGGWGIGLALARRVVEEGHGGTLSLEPNDEGTTFIMRFPRAEAS